MNARYSAMTLAASILTLVSAASQASAPLRVLKTFDGQVFACSHPADLGRVAYRKTSQSGLIKEGNLEVTINIETVKCVEQAGKLDFVPHAIAGRVVNKLNGFVEFQTLEFITYTPDFQVVRKQAMNLGKSQHRVTFTAPVNAFVGLLSRNTNRVDGRQIGMIGFLRGNAHLGDARTGQVQEAALVPFGAYDIFLAERDNTLAFASQKQGSLDPQILP